MTFRAGVVATLFLTTACSNGATPQVATPTDAPVVAVVAAPDSGDQPAFAVRTGRPPTLSLQELFHPTYSVPTSSTEIRTLLVTGDVIPARGVNDYQTARHDYLVPCRPTAASTKMPAIP